jgi:hypothetical protein
MAASTDLVDFSDEDDADEANKTIRRPYWLCQECCHQDYRKPMPKDRSAFYTKPESPKCPKCNSTGFSPIGW